MRTRNAGKPKPEAQPKKTPPSRRSSTKAPPNPPPEADVTTSDNVEQTNPTVDAMEVTPETKITRGKTRSSTRKTPASTKTPTSARASSRRTPKSKATEEVQVEKNEEMSENIAEESMKSESEKEAACEIIAEESMTKVETIVENVEVTDNEGIKTVSNTEEISIMEEMTCVVEQSLVQKIGDSSKTEEESEHIAEESIAKVESVIENVDKADKEEIQISRNVEEPPKVEEPMVLDIKISSEKIEENTIETEEPSEVEEKILEKEENVDQCVKNIEESSKADEDTIHTEQPSEKCDMNIEESLKFEEKTLGMEENVDPKEPSELDEDIMGAEQPLDKSDMGVQESLKFEENTLEKEENEDPEEHSHPDEDTIGTEQSLDKRDMDVEEPLKFEEETLEKEENLDQKVTKPEKPLKTDEDSNKNEQLLVSHDGEAISQKEEILEIDIKDKGKKELNEEIKTLEDKIEPDNEPAEYFMDEDINQVENEKDAKISDESLNKEKLEESADALEVERVELNAATKERKLRKEMEIFVGGLDRDTAEEDLKKVFESIGEIIEVKLPKDLSSNKNKGYAFVKFATKELATKALLEMKNPLIREKRCRTAPSEDNDMLFLGNICNTWTEETINQKLKDYGVTNVENINLIQDTRHEGLSKGFAFLEFSCHADAMQAFKRLQKPDAIFGRTDRTAKVAFAEPVREPAPEVMVQVKSVFVDGLPPQWNEDKVREKLKGCGEIIRITLARNMPNAKRRDFGFIDFNSHEDAVACIESINSKDFGEGKAKVRARLSNPSPKIQAVKGEISGGFKISRGASSSRPGRGSGLGGNAFSRPNFQRDRVFHQRGRGQPGRVGFTRERDAQTQYPPFQRREMFGRGGWRDHVGPAHDTFPPIGQPSMRPNFDMMRHNEAAAGIRGHERPTPISRLPFNPEEGYNGSVMGSRHMEDPYFYDSGGHGIKRPYSMTEPDYMERSRLRPRMDYSDPPLPYRAPSYRDSVGPDRNLHGPDRNLHPPNYYGPDYREGPRPAFHGSAYPYGGGYPPRY